ncbi:MAG: hypothetical protein Q9M48_07600 [Rhodobacterales bacterium]|nr:hypothetical protein [Rhodobacterales bacterium]
MSYLQQHNAKAIFTVEPRLSVENWRKFKTGDIRKLRIGVASPDNFKSVEDDAVSVAQSFKAMGKDYGASSITIELGMGNRKGALSKKAKALASKFSKLLGRIWCVKGSANLCQR